MLGDLPESLANKKKTNHETQGLSCFHFQPNCKQ